MVQALEGLAGVKKAVANFSEKNALVYYDPAAVGPDGMIQALLTAGYVASISGKDKKTSNIFKLPASEKTTFKMEDLVCFCFGYTRSDIEKDYLENVKSQILERIASEKKIGGCNCAVKNPKGR